MEEYTKNEIKYIAETTDKEEFQLMLKASELQLAVDTYYEEIFRGRLKYPDDYNLTEEQYSLVEKIADEVHDHFKDCFRDF
jgi:hypothetical protein